MNRALDVNWIAASDGQFQCSTAELPPRVQAIRYHLPIEICRDGRGSGLFHYCCYVYPANQLSPVGYCAQGCQGHPSRAAAREHYRQYLIDRFGQYDGKLAAPGACAVCGLGTTHYVWVDFHYDWEIAPLCAAHLNRDGLAHAFVFKDYHLLQISDTRSKAIVTFAELDAPVCVVLPPQKHIPVTTAPEPSNPLPPSQIPGPW